MQSIDWQSVALFLGICGTMSLPINKLVNDLTDERKAKRTLKLLEAQSAVDDCDLEQKIDDIGGKVMELETRQKVSEQNNANLQKTMEKLEKTVSDQADSLKRDFRTLEAKMDSQHNQVMEHLLKSKG